MATINQVRFMGQFRERVRECAVPDDRLEREIWLIFCNSYTFLQLHRAMQKTAQYDSSPTQMWFTTLVLTLLQTNSVDIEAAATAVSNTKAHLALVDV
jgi:hypothetical protein